MSLWFHTNTCCAFTAIIRDGIEIGVIGWRPDIDRKPSIRFYKEVELTFDELQEIMTRFEVDKTKVDQYNAISCHGSPGMSGYSGTVELGNEG